MAKWHGDAQDIMGTKISVALWLEDDQKAEQAVAAVMAEMRRIDEHFSPYITTSELYRVNQLAPKASAKNPLSISPELAAIIDKANHYSELSDGAFDITFASLGRYYDYRNKLTPSEQQREELLPAINYRLIHLDTKNNTLWFEHPKVYIDLGGIAKGYAVDKAIEVVQSFGVKHASVTAGGDSRVIGDKFGRPWLIGIKNPRADAVAITLPLVDVAVSTSGDYERYFIDDRGERVHHIINPRTGKSTNGVNSVTIIGPLGFDTDPLSTTVFVLGPEKGMALINRVPGFDAVIIASDGKVSYSKGLAPPD
ncbi:thiamine biosynthesis lipoprotein [Cellvibrio fibrivorans]|uniref:FAD:protein FMN transferase n=1 Tax=Cellvibrio fibrivorans TaxID=126350 RepID=A0ABU1V1I4_9GAMM|nr:thiamine biosynthesis lipoprotein [Cellvibrio fibrivorans]